MPITCLGWTTCGCFPTTWGTRCRSIARSRSKRGSASRSTTPLPRRRKNYGGGVPQIAFHRITTEPFEVLCQRMMPIRLEHGRFRVLGFRFGNVAYCTDTNGIPPESWPLLEGLDVLVLDALRHKPHPTHFSLDEAVDVARRLGAKRTLFTHMSHDLEHEATNASLPPGMELAYDGLRIPLTDG